MGHIEEVCKGNLVNHRNQFCEDIGGEQSVRLDEFEEFIEDYSNYIDFDAEYSVPNGEHNQVEMEIIEGMLSDDIGDAFYIQNGDGFDYSGDDSDDSDYIVDGFNLQFDVDVDEHGIINKKTENVGNDIVHEEWKLFKVMIISMQDFMKMKGQKCLRS
ncbi:unnamed protein product [Lactuca saligna]|uniref:Uncharacterized protein n=1 Tax=Lactuca saligna TaxID=75948 RepID=A0AA35YBH0_LACSI|nr:unnamed protein product [Lactuca saligna]